MGQEKQVEHESAREFSWKCGMCMGRITGRCRNVVITMTLPEECQFPHVCVEAGRKASRNCLNTVSP